jgi:hypothetical protein
VRKAGVSTRLACRRVDVVSRAGRRRRNARRATYLQSRNESPAVSEYLGENLFWRTEERVTALSE